MSAQPASSATTGSPLPASLGSDPSQSSPGSPAAASGPLPSTTLTSGEAVGVSIAAMGSVILAIAAIYLFFWLRRRRVTHRDERESYDFVDEAPPRFSPFNYGYADPRGPLGGFNERRVELMAEKTNAKWLAPRASEAPAQHYEKSDDVSPESRNSMTSMRTLSQLLPEKPASTHSRPTPKSPAPSAYTATTMFEEDRPPIPSRKPLPSLPVPGSAIHYPPPTLSKPYRPQYAERLTRSPIKERQPCLSLEIPKSAARSSHIPSLDSFPLPPRSTQAHTAYRPSTATGSSDESRISTGSVLNYYASPEAGFDSSPELNPPTPIASEAQKRKAVPNAITVTKATYPPRAVRITSTGSDTSFESVATDEPTPPEEPNNQLTPVAESPLAGIRYPKVPRSSNQSVPRSPASRLSPVHAKHLPPVSPQDDRSLLSSRGRQQEAIHRNPVTPERKATSSSGLSGSTLAAKRIGNNAAQDLERRFHVTDSSHSRGNSHATTHTSKSEPNSGKSRHTEHRGRQESPLKGYGRVASGGMRAAKGVPRLQTGVGVVDLNSPPHLWSSTPGQPQHVSMKSPLWEPKITPSRRGDDLYLDVGVATPRTGDFTPMHDRFHR
ncbi:hypothetical protein LTR37_002516 [Vermiconidia calcicola]|uniref:Uncharacterized protein n=1 Tax=Vermiconidia calcicola TaxID=1690605 RepID=A0ACC3NTA5_9PEZI|nr:hypothetical protein LTR37_002516 [Vermiconidia calcicola]